MPRRATLSALAVTASVALIAGCGGGSSGGGSTGGTNNSSSAPATELTSAIDALGSASTIDAIIKLTGTGSDLQAFVKQQEPTTKLTAAQAAEIAGIQIELEATAPSGKTLSGLGGSSGAGASNITISDQGKSLITLRVVNKTLYFQVAAKDLFDKLGQSASYAQIQAGASQLPTFAQALIQGKWVSLPETTAKSLGNQLGGSSSGSGNQAVAAALLSKLKVLLTKDVTVTRTSSGSTDELTLTGNTRTLAGDFVRTFASTVPAASSLATPDVSNVPSKTLTVKASVSGGALAGISVDLGQFAKSGSGSLPISLTIARSGPSISAPSGAVPVDVAQLGSLLGAFGGGL